jgi:hypothetical protein
MDTDKILDLITARAIEPWEQIGRSLAEQKAIEALNSAEARECGRLAAEIIRIAAELDLDSRDMCRRSVEWALISAAAEAGRSRLLSSAARRTTLTAASCFEADGNGKYRFINNRVTIVQPAGGKAEFLPTAAEAIKFLVAELGLGMGWAEAIPDGQLIFAPSVVLDAGPDKERVFEGLQIQFYKRGPCGDLAKYQPQDWQLELKTSG